MKFSNLYFRVFYALISLFFLNGCENMELEAEKVSVESVTLNTESIEIEIGQSQTLTATISPSDAANQKVIWSTSNSAVAIVTEGVVTGVSAGSATITAKSDDGGKIATCEVIVKSFPATIGPATLELDKITATTASFLGKMNVSKNDIPFSSVTLYYSDDETFSIGTAQSLTLSTFSDDKNIALQLSGLKFNTEYSYSLLVKVRAEETFMDVRKFTTADVKVELEIDESSFSEWPVMMNGSVSGLSVEDRKDLEIGVIWSSLNGVEQNISAVKMGADEISEDGKFTLILSDWLNLRDYYYCSYVSQGDNCTYGQEKKFTVDFTRFSSRLVTVEEVGYDYYTVKIKVPEDLTAAGNHVHFSFGDMWSLYYNCNGKSIEEYIRKSFSGQCSGCVDSDWFWQTKQTKRIVVDENLGVVWPIKPSEPVCVAVAEVTSAGELVGNPEVHMFRTTQPSQLNAGFEITFNKITSIDAEISVVPDDDIVKWYCMIVSDDDYHSILSNLDDESDFQWFVTSGVAASKYVTDCLNQSSLLHITDAYVASAVTPDTKYHLILTGYGDELGTKQCFKHVEFETTSKKRTKAPVIEVTPLPEESTHFSAAFRVKCTSYDDPASGPIVSCVSYANYIHDWLYDTDYSQTLSRSGTKFTSEQLDAINSENGYVMHIPVIDGMELRFGVKGENDELDSSGPVVVDYATPDYRADAVTSDFLTTDILEGEWVMTATDIDGKELETTVNIIRSLKEGRDYQSGCPKEFLEQVDIFNQTRLVDKNSLLLQGWFLDSKWGKNGPYEYRSPYDLLMAQDYNAATYQQLFFAAGPKIFMEVKPDGKLVVISDAHRYMPVEAWGTWLYLGGVSANRNAVLGNYSAETPSQIEFPVTISDDNETLTIEPADYNGTRYYLNVLRMQGNLNADILVNSPIVLKKK